MSLPITTCGQFTFVAITNEYIKSDKILYLYDLIDNLHKFNFYEEFVYSEYKGKFVYQFLKEDLKNNTYIVGTFKHVLAIVNGKIYDSNKKSKFKKIIYILKLKKL